MTDIYLHFLFAHYGLYGNAPVLSLTSARLRVFNSIQRHLCPARDDSDYCCVGVTQKRGLGGSRLDGCTMRSFVSATELAVWFVLSLALCVMYVRGHLD